MSDDSKTAGRIQRFNNHIETRYKAGWGFAQFEDGKPANEAVHNTCFACHQPLKERDFVFTLLGTLVPRTETFICIPTIVKVRAWQI